MKEMLRFAVFALATLGLFGCSVGEDPHLVSVRNQFLLSESPQGALEVMQAREQVAEQAEEILLRGRIAAGKHEPFRDGRASFLVCDTTLFQHDDATEGHDPDSCPFCKRRQSSLESLALIQFTDARGKILSIDARELFDLKKDQIVTVRGTGQVDENGNFIVEAKELYLTEGN